MLLVKYFFVMYRFKRILLVALLYCLYWRCYPCNRRFCKAVSL